MTVTIVPGDEAESHVWAVALEVGRLFADVPWILVGAQMVMLLEREAGRSSGRPRATWIPSLTSGSWPVEPGPRPTGSSRLASRSARQSTPIGSSARSVGRSSHQWRPCRFPVARGR
jgi:hypothetical protein